jgi:hypothetical protein
MDWNAYVSTAGDSVIYTEWLSFAMMATGLIVLRTRASYKPEYRSWGARE